MYVKDYKRRKASLPGPPQRLSLQQWHLERESATRARVCVCFWVFAACSNALALECEARAERGCVRGVGGKGGGGGEEKKSVCSWVVVQPKAAMVCLGWNRFRDVALAHLYKAYYTFSEEIPYKETKDKEIPKINFVVHVDRSPCLLSTRLLHRIANCGSDLQGGVRFPKKGEERDRTRRRPAGAWGAAIDRASRQGGEREGRGAREYEGSSSGVDLAPGGAARRLRAVLPPRTRPEGGHREGEAEPRVLGQAEPAVEGPGRRA